MRRRAGIRRVGSTERRGALQEVQSRSTEKEFRTAIREAKRIRRFRHPAQGILEIREAEYVEDLPTSIPHSHHPHPHQFYMLSIGGAAHVEIICADHTGIY